MPSVRVDTGQLIAGACVVSAYSGHGIRGADVPSTGQHGPAILYPGLTLPAEANDEFRALILTRPVGLTQLDIGEDSSIIADGPVGVYAGNWRGYKNGVIYGPDPSTYTITIVPAAEVSGSATLEGVAAAGALTGGTPSALSGGATLDDVAASGNLGVSGLIGSATLGDVSASGALTGGTPSALAGAATLDDVAAAGALTGGTPSALAGAATLDDVAASGALASVPSVLGGAAVLDDLVADGALQGQTPLDALDVYTLRAPQDQIRYTGGFAPKDPAAEVILAFEFRRFTVEPTSPDVSIVWLRGADDPTPNAVLVGIPVVIGSVVYQRVAGGVALADYELRCEADAPDGTRWVMAGTLPVRPVH